MTGLGCMGVEVDVAADIEEDDIPIGEEDEEEEVEFVADGDFDDANKGEFDLIKFNNLISLCFCIFSGI